MYLLSLHWLPENALIVWITAKWKLLKVIGIPNQPISSEKPAWGQEEETCIQWWMSTGLCLWRVVPCSGTLVWWWTAFVSSLLISSWGNPRTNCLFGAGLMAACGRAPVSQYFPNCWCRFVCEWTTATPDPAGIPQYKKVGQVCMAQSLMVTALPP